MALLEQMAVPVVAGLFGLAPVIVQGITNRSRERQTASRIGRLKEELEFAEKLHGLRKAAVCDEEDLTRTDEVLADALRRLTVRYEALSRGEVRRSNASAPALSELSFPRRLLLAFQPITPNAWVLHTLFYACCLFAAALLINEALSPTIDDETGAPFGWTTMLLGMAVVLGVPGLVLRGLALRSYAQTLRKRHDALKS